MPKETKILCPEAFPEKSPGRKDRPAVSFPARKEFLPRPICQEKIFPGESPEFVRL